MTFANKRTDQVFLTFSTHFQQASFFYLFAVIFLLRLNNLASKSVFVIKFACANHAVKTSGDKVLNSKTATYLS